MSTKTTFKLEICDEGSISAPPVEIQLRKVLKTALRLFGLRCVLILPAPTASPAPTATPETIDAPKVDIAADHPATAAAGGSR